MNDAAKIVGEFLRLLMIPGPDAAVWNDSAEWLLVRAGLAKP